MELRRNNLLQVSSGWSNRSCQRAVQTVGVDVSHFEAKLLSVVNRKRELEEDNAKPHIPQMIY